MPDGGRRAVMALLVAAAALLGIPASAQTPPSAAPSPAPCRSAEHRQFDFWIGHWEVARPDGKPAGTNRIESVFGGCALQEDWSSAAGGYQGRSLNALGADGRWHQTWVDTSGLLLQLTGGIRDGRMVLSGERTSRQGGTVRDEVSWEPLPTGRVKQHWRSSNDDGKTWTDVFVGIYTKKR